MSNVDEFDQIINSFSRISLLVQLKEKVSEAALTTRARCGSCAHWMRSSSCPKETRVNGRRRGPSCDSTACQKFEIEDHIVELRNKRIAEAIAFATKHDLPIPASLSAAISQSPDEEPRSGDTDGPASPEAGLTP